MIQSITWDGTEKKERSEPGWTPGERDCHKILADRARDLATSRDIVQDKAEYVQVLEFYLSGEQYAVDMSYIREVAIMKEISTLPGIPAFILGIINLRGTIVSIVDLRVILDLPSRGLTDYNRVIVLQDGSISFGILADAIIMTKMIDFSKMSSPPPTVSKWGASYLLGVQPGPLMVLDAKALLHDTRMVVGNEDF